MLSICSTLSVLRATLTLEAACTGEVIVDLYSTVALTFIVLCGCSSILVDVLTIILLVDDDDIILLLFEEVNVGERLGLRLLVL